MPKRKNYKEEKWLKKLKKYEEKLRKRRRTSSSSEDEGPAPSHSSPDNHRRSLDRFDSSALNRPPSRGDARPPSMSPPPPTALSPPPVLSPPPPPTNEQETPLQLPAAALLPEAVVVPPVSPAVLPVQPVLQPDGTVTTATAPTADPELLQALGIFEAESDEWGPIILDDLAKRWQPILKDGLKKEAKEDLIKKYPLPKNCPLMRPPALNPEIAAVLNESAKNRDGRLLKKQTQLGCAFAILGKTMSDILTKSISTPEVLTNLADLAKILADSHFSETETRRSLIIPTVDKAFIEPFKNRKRDSLLFGDKLSDFIKNSRGIQKTGKLIQPATILNSKSLASRHLQQQQQRPSRQASRAGETRAVPYQQYRRRAPFPPAMNNRALPPPPLAQTTHATAPAPPSRKQAAAPSYRRKQ